MMVPIGPIRGRNSPFLIPRQSKQPKLTRTPLQVVTNSVSTSIPASLIERSFLTKNPLKRISDTSTWMRKIKVIGEGNFKKIWSAEVVEDKTPSVGYRKAVYSAKLGTDEAKDIIAGIEASRALGDHSNVLSAPSVFETKENIIAMYELYDGTAADVIDDLSKHEALKLMKMVNAGLTSIHSKGWVWADARPENILIKHHKGKKGSIVIDEAVIADFGLTKKSDAYKRFEGHLHYRAPHAEKSAQKTDAWAEGLTFFQIYFGRDPQWLDDITAPLSEVQVAEISDNGYQISLPVQSKEGLLRALISGTNRITQKDVIGAMLKPRGKEDKIAYKVISGLLQVNEKKRLTTEQAGTYMEKLDPR